MKEEKSTEKPSIDSNSLFVEKHHHRRNKCPPKTHCVPHLIQQKALQNRGWPKTTRRTAYFRVNLFDSCTSSRESKCCVQLFLDKVDKHCTARLLLLIAKILPSPDKLMVTCNTLHSFVPNNETMPIISKGD